jgi:hypothetical protein
MKPNIQNHTELKDFFADLVAKKIELRADEEIKEEAESQEDGSPPRKSGVMS